MKDIEYKTKLQQAFLVARLLLQLEELPEIIDAMNHAEDVGCFIDPTAWVRGVGAMQEQRTIVVALLKAKQAIEPARDNLLNEIVRQQASV